jgi:hypothetical protein
MKYPIHSLNDLLNLFNCKSKRELDKLAKNIIIHQQDFVAIILAAQHNELNPYNYANYFDRRIPDHLMPTEEEHEAISNNGVGKYKTRKAQKFANKIFQLPIQQRMTAAHLFYTSDHQYWNLFFFDDKDRSEYGNHWKHGPHIHFVSDLCSNLSLLSAWEKICSGKFSFSNKFHLKFVDD